MEKIRMIMTNISIFKGNTIINDLKIIFGSVYDLPLNKVCFSLSEEFLNKIKDIENLENKKNTKVIFNDSLYELLLLKNNLVPDLKPKEKIEYSYETLEREPLAINDELSPKLKKILQEWLKEFTGGAMKMDNKSTLVFIKSVISSYKDIIEDNEKLKEFIQVNDKDNKGYI